MSIIRRRNRTKLFLNNQYFLSRYSYLNITSYEFSNDKSLWDIWKLWNMLLLNST